MTRQTILTGFLSLNLFAASAQAVEVIQQSDFIKQAKPDDFSFIEPSTDINSVTFVATIKATGVDNYADIEYLFYNVKEKAYELGANSFKLKDFVLSGNPIQIDLTLDVYHGSDSLVNLNFDSHEKNVVYIFGDLRKSGDAQMFRVDNVKQELKAGTYYRHQNQEGQEVKVNKGGLTGATMWIVWKEDKPATFLTLTGFALGGGQVPTGTVGLAFNTGRIRYVDGNFGHLLVQLLDGQ